MIISSIDHCWRAFVTANALGRELVAQYGLDPVSASRFYMLSNVTQCMAFFSEDGLVSPADCILLASQQVVQSEFPQHSAALADGIDRATKRRFRESVTAGKISRFLRARRSDGSSRRSQTVLPYDDELWRTLENRPPVRPHWGNVRPFAIATDDLFLSPPPPAVGSPKHLDELELVRNATSEITARQHQAVRFWSCDIGGETPTGRWQLLSEAMLRQHIEFNESLFIITLSSIAMFNAGVSCWLTKFRHWFPRPQNVDPSVRAYMHIPNFPSYTSGHACFSYAAATVIGTMVPSISVDVIRMADEAGNSRVWGGVHYPMDTTAGAAVGRAMGVKSTSALLDVVHVLRAADADAVSFGA